jgi:hypothetical protein
MDLVDLVARVANHRCIDVNDLCIDISQCADRVVKNVVENKLTSIARNSLFYHFGQDRVLVGEEMAALFGFNATNIERRCTKAMKGMDELELRDLVFGAMHMGHVTTMLTAIIVALGGILKPKVSSEAPSSVGPSSSSSGSCLGS